MYANEHLARVHGAWRILLFWCSLKDLSDFIEVVDKGLAHPIKEGDYSGLIQVMGHLMAVKERQSATDDMFEPIKETIELLKTYNQDMSDEVHLQLEVGLHCCCPFIIIMM